MALGFDIYAKRPDTLRALVDSGEVRGVEIRCAPCRKGLSIPLAALVAQFGPDAPQPKHAGPFKCPSCRRKPGFFSWVGPNGL